MISRDSIIREARSWLGTRWQHQASLRGVGTDCIGMVLGVANACGVREAAEFIAAPEFKGYGREPNSMLVLLGCERWLDPIPVARARPGDVLVMRFNLEPQHFGIMTRIQPDYLIHAYAQARKVVENRIDDLWRSRILRAYSFRMIEPWRV